MTKPLYRHTLPALLSCASYVGELVALVLCQLLDLLHVVACQAVDGLFQVGGAIF